MSECMILGRLHRKHQISEWEYTTNDTATLLTKYVGRNADVVVPTTFNDKSTILSTGVFEGTSVNSVDLCNVKFSNNDMSNAFNGCSNLKSVSNLTNSVTTLNDAFSNAVNLTKVSCRYSSYVIRIANGVRAFSNCKSLTSVPNIGFSSIQASLPSVNVVSAFENCSNLKNINMPMVGISVPYNNSTFNAYKCFSNCVNLTSLETYGLTIRTVANMDSMFYNTGFAGLGNMTNRRGDINIAMVTLRGNISMANAFSKCRNLSVANFNQVKGGKINMSSIFSNCLNLSSVVDFPEDVTNTAYAFAYTNLNTAVNIPDSVSDMSYMYAFCSNLTNVPLTAIALNTTSMASTFCNCSKITSIPLVPPRVNNLTNAFRNCTNLTGNIPIYAKGITNNNILNAFNGTSKAKNVYIYNTGVNTTNNTWNSAFNTTYGINGKNGVTVVNMETWENSCWEYSKSGWVTKYKGSDTEVFVPATFGGVNVPLRRADSGTSPFYDKRSNIKVVKFQDGVSFESNTMSECFSGATNLVAVYGIPSTVQVMNNTFSYCSNLTKVSAIPNSATVIDGAFWMCTNLVNAPSLAYATNITNMDGTFLGCSNLKSVDYIPSKLYGMNQTFQECTSLVNVPNITCRTASYFNMRKTFENCKSLVNAPDLTGTNIYVMDNAFRNCSNLKNTPKSLPNGIYGINSTFMNCTSLVNAPVIPESLRFMDSTFRGCTNLTGNIVIKTNGIASTAAFCGAQNCFLDTALPKNVYIPFKGLNTTSNTYNAFKGYNGQNGVTIYNVNDYTG